MFKRNRPRVGELTEAAKAFAGLTGALAIVAKTAAAWFAPTGIAALAIGLGFRSPPILAIAAMLLSALAAIFAVLYGFSAFFSWLKR
jgi:hypothetical protein